ncbi:MAG: hypothetical protein C4346_15035, partial [Chloroflexota bacterium]
LAGEKSTWPGKKQVVRIGTFERDIIQLDHEPMPAHGRPLLQPAIRDGEIVPGVLVPLLDIKQRAAAALAELPEQYKA